MEVDVLIVGGGPAGLSAALVLGRCRRRVVVVDDGHQRNRTSDAIHGLLGQEGMPPTDFLHNGRSGLAKYPTLFFVDTRVVEIDRVDGSFRFTCADGTRGTASKILLATGLEDQLPQLEGIDELYGKSVHHCIYCDGFEYAGQPIAAYGKGDRGAELAVMLKHWSSDVVACSDGTMPSDEALGKLRAFDIPLWQEPIKTLHGQEGRLNIIHFMNGLPLARSAMFFATGCHQRSDLADRLACRRDSKGGVITNPLTEETTAPGVYVAGDASRDVLLVAVAVGEGAKSAVAINKALLRRDGFCS